MNEAKLKEIEDGCSAATPAPWWVEYREYTDKTGMIRHTPTVTTQDTDISIVYVDADAEGDLSPDAAFIANARIYVPMLIAEVRRLKSYGDMYRSIAELRQIERDNIAALLDAVPWVALDAVIEHRDDISDWNQAREWLDANRPEMAPNAHLA